MNKIDILILNVVNLVIFVAILGMLLSEAMSYGGIGAVFGK